MTSGSASRPAPLAIVEQEARQPEDRVHRRAELVGHVREEARLQLVGAAQVVRLLVELGVEGHHAAVGVLELAVQVRELLLLALQIVERPQQRLVLLLDLLHQADRLLARDRLRDLADAFGGDQLVPRRQELVEGHRGAAGGGLDAEADPSAGARPRSPSPSRWRTGSGRTARRPGAECPGPWSVTVMTSRWGLDSSSTPNSTLPPVA